MNRKFLRMVFLVRTVLQYNGKFNREDIIDEILKRFKAYEDIEILRMEEYPISTFDKDKKVIKDAWKIDLEYKNNLYYINTDFESVFQNDILNSLIFLSSINTDMLLPSYVITETRKNTGMEYFHTISSAIEKNLCLKISYFDYVTENENEKLINPYRLKQKDFKWYVLAKDINDGAISFKSYALERIRTIDILGKFKSDLSIDFETPYKDSIGMFTNESPTKVVVEYDHRDGNYLKANPIHHSQKILSQKENRITFEFFIKPNEDFIMELMKRSWSLKVIEPIFLKQKIMNYWKLALERNE